MGICHGRRRRACRCAIPAFVESGLVLSILVILITLGATSPASAQNLYGSIVGTVTDPTGAVVPDATVKATQTETNETRTAITNHSGVYALATVAGGTYIVSIAKPGFDLFEANGISLTINTTVRVDA